MLPAALVLAVLLAALALVLPRWLSGAGWAMRAPVCALVLWQAAGLATGLVVLELAATVALAPLGPTHSSAVRRLLGGPHLSLPLWAYAAAVLGGLVLLRLVSVLVASTLGTVRARRRNRVLVDLVASRNVLLRGTHVVDHAIPVAYCLPGLRPRLVLSRGVLALLSWQEVSAVLAHEQAHLVQRHDLVVLPFVALDATFPRCRPARTARGSVALLVELLADDRAAREHDRTCLARALWKIGSAQVPAGSLGAGGQDTLVRAQRLLEPPAAVPVAQAVALAGLAAAVLASPALGLAVPYLLG